MLKQAALLLGLILLTTMAVGDAQGDGLRYFEFTITGHPDAENFVAATRDTDVVVIVDWQLSLPLSERNLHINGPIDSTNGGFNMEWSWHHVPNQWVMAEISFELCDGIPSFVEADLPYWLHNVGGFCPWGSKVLREVPAPTCCSIRGDVNHDGSDPVDIADVVFLIAYMFNGGPEPPCSEAGVFPEADVNGDGGPPDIADLVYLAHYMFAQGPPPPPCD